MPNTEEEIKKKANLDRFSSFLEKYNSAIRGGDQIDLSLYYLLSMFREEISPLIAEPYYFHKAFRQIDVVTSVRKPDDDYPGCIDSVIYNLIHASEIFWTLFGKEFFADRENNG